MKEQKEKEKIRLLINAYLSGELPDDVQQRLQAWLIKNCEHPQHTKTLRDVWDEKVRVSNDPMSEEARIRFEQYKTLLGFPQDYAEETERLMHKLKEQERIRALRTRNRTLWRIAAAAVLIPVLFFAVGKWWTESSVVKDDDSKPTLTEVLVPPETEEIKHIVMADESQVDVQPGSRVKYAGDFADRRVKLEGQAHFHVEKQTNAQGEPTRFTVETGHLSVTVLGTDFSIHCPASDEHSEIDLYHGKVEVQAGGTVSILMPGDHFYYNHATGEHRITRIPVAEREYIRMDELFFEGAGFEAIFDSIQKNYGVQIVVNGPLPAEKVRADFRDATSIEEILVSLSKINKGFAYRVKGEQVDITFNE